MSNRSAKLLLEVADSINLRRKRHPNMKMCGSDDIPLDVGLVHEIITWERGYRDHIKQSQKIPKISHPTKVHFEDIEIGALFVMETERNVQRLCTKTGPDMAKWYGMSGCTLNIQPKALVYPRYRIVDMVT